MRKNVNIGRSLGHIDVPQGMLIPLREVDQWPDEKVVIVSTGSQGEPLSALRRMAYRDHPQVELRAGDTVVFSATPIPGNERAVNETIDRLYHVGCDVVTTRDAPIHASGHGHAEELKLMLNLTHPRYVMPVHGDYKRMLLHSQLAEAVGVPAEHIFRLENGLPLEIDANGARSATGSRAASCSWTGSRSGTSRTWRCATAACSPPTASSSSWPPSRRPTARPSSRRRCWRAACPSSKANAGFVEELREAVEDSLDRAADQRVTEIEVLESMLHDDLAGFIYDRLRRRPMVLPVIVEV